MDASQFFIALAGILLAARLAGELAIRLGAPSVPGKPLSFSGQVAQKSQEGDECVLELAVRAASELGDHATGTVIVTLPAT